MMSFRAFNKISAVLYQNRYCDQEDFDLIVSSELSDDYYNKEAIIYKINYPGFTKAKEVYSNFKFNIFDQILPCESSVLATSSKGLMYYDVDGFGYFTSKLFGNSFDGSLPKEIVVRLPDERQNYCVCSFMRNLYVFDGQIPSYIIIKSNICLKYDTTTNEWSCISEMNIARAYAACTVFEGKIVVSGGLYNLKSVEAYDYHENQWSCLPDMIQGKCSHGSVSLGNKLFVIGYASEVFDNLSRVFTEIKKINHKSYSLRRTALIGIDYKIIVFGTLYKGQDKLKAEILFVYDILSDQWIVKENKITKKVSCCTKVPVV